MFNGEYRSFIFINTIICKLDSFIDIGAVRDFFYIDMLYDKHCLLVEPGKQNADLLKEHINVHHQGLVLSNKDGRLCCCGPNGHGVTRSR